MPLRYLQLRRQQDPNYDLVSLRGLYCPENGVKAPVEELDVDDWDNWMRWDVGTTGLLTPDDEATQINTGNLSSPDAYFSDLEFPGKDEVPALSFAGNEMAFEDAPFDMDEDAESLLFSPTSSNGSLFLPEVPKPYGLAANLPTTGEVSKKTDTISTTRSTRTKVSRPLQIETAARVTKKRRTQETEPKSSCLSKKRGHNAIEKRYRTNLNEKINCLRDALPTIAKSNSDTKTGEEDSDEEDIDNKNGQQKFGKAAILTRALEYIKHLERNTQKLGMEIDTLKSRVGAFERLAMSGTSASHESSVSEVPAWSMGLTLESIQEEFTQVKPKPRSRSRSTTTITDDAEPSSKRTKRQGRPC